jgi:hypothetical protein
MEWRNEFKNRLDNFEKEFGDDKGTSISIKLRIESGCFHREHAPYSYQLIDKAISEYQLSSEKTVLVEHESGPEILVYISSGLIFGASVIDLIAAIINSRNKGREKGDSTGSHLNIIIRKFDKEENIREEKVLEIGNNENVDKRILKELLENALSNLFKDTGEKKKK